MLGESVVARDQIFPQRQTKEVQEAEHLEQLIAAELRKHEGAQDEPDYITVEFDRTSPDGIDRYSDHILGVVVDLYIGFGWKGLRAYLGDGNTKIKLLFK